MFIFSKSGAALSLLVAAATFGRADGLPISSAEYASRSVSSLVMAFPFVSPSTRTFRAVSK
jgi:hypothetical protein